MLNSAIEPSSYDNSGFSWVNSVRATDGSNDPLNPNGYRLETRFNMEELAACPVWQDDAPNPPVPANDAIRLADDAIPTLSFPGPDGIWHRQTATLTLVANHWCWVVDYKNAENSLLTGGFSIVVLMDGTVVTPHCIGNSLER